MRTSRQWMATIARALRRALPGAAVALAAGCGTGSPVAPIVVPPLDSIQVVPDTLRVRAGRVALLTVVGWDTAGVAIPGIPASWSSSDPAGVILTVDSQGRVRGVSEGSAWVFAAVDSLRDSALVIVEPASPGWFAQTSNAAGVELRGVFFLPDGRSGWAVGDGGRILATMNAGATWTSQTSNTGFSLRDVWFTGPDTGFAVGAAGTILRTLDGGAVWQRVDSNAGEVLEDVWFANRDTGWVVGASGVVLRTVDRGVTWSRRQITPFTLRGVAFAGTRDGWAVGDGGVIAGTHDGGLTWFTVVPFVTGQSLSAVWRRSEAVAHAVGQNGVTPRTVRPDTTRWQLHEVGFERDLEGVHFPTDAIGYAVGYQDVGLILKTVNGGVAWSPQASSTQFRLHAVHFVDDRRGWAVGANGTILHTGSGGE